MNKISLDVSVIFRELEELIEFVFELVRVEILKKAFRLVADMDLR